MTLAQSLAGLAGALLLLGLGSVWHAGLGSILLELAGVGGLLGGTYVLLRPLAVEVTCYRVRYAYPTLAPELDPQQVGARLAVLARYGERVSLCWQQGETPALYLIVPRAVARPLQKLLPEIWPGAVLEPVAAILPPPERPRTWVVRALHPAGTGGPADPLDFRPSRPPAISWLHWQRTGVAVVEGWPGAAPAERRGWPLPLRGRVAAWTAAHWPWMTPLVAHRAAVRWPRTDTAATRALDPHATLVLPPPATYQPPADLASLGRSIVGDQPMGVDLGDPTAWGHLLWLAPPTPGRTVRVLRLLEQAGAAGWGVVLVDGSGDLTATFYGQSAPSVRARVQRVDLLNPRPPLRPGWLAAPGTTAAAALATALSRAAEEGLPAYLQYLGYLGLTPAGLGRAATLVPAWIGAALVAHYRARLLGVPPPPLPEVPALLAAWTRPDDLAGLVQAEAVAWTSPTGALARALDAAGPAGAGARGAALAWVRRGERVLAALTADDRRLYTVALHSRLAAVIRRAPALERLWTETQAATGLLATATPPLILMDLSGGAGSDAGQLAAGWYGLYWLAVLEAVSRDRARDPAVPPLLVVWAGLAPVWAMVAPATLGRISRALRAGGIHLVGLDRGVLTVPAPMRQALPQAWETWLLGTLPAAEAAAWDAALRVQGAPAGFSCSALPPDTAVLRSATGLCTVRIEALPAGRAVPGAPPPSRAPAARSPVGTAPGGRTDPGMESPDESRPGSQCGEGEDGC